MTPDQFLEKAHEKHGEKFSYPELPEIIMERTRIRIVCELHGEWTQRCGSHIREGYGCRKCTNIARYGADHPSRVAKFKQKRQETFDKRFGGHPMKDKRVSQKAARTWANKTPEEISGIMAKKAETFRLKYGYENPFDSEEVKQSIYELRRERGEWSKEEDIPEAAAYKRQVASSTEKNWRKFQNTINHDGLERGPLYHLDHKFSVNKGFKTGIPPEIIAHPANLCLIPAQENLRKNRKCSIDLRELEAQIECWDKSY